MVPRTSKLLTGLLILVTLGSAPCGKPDLGLRVRNDLDTRVWVTRRDGLEIGNPDFPGVALRLEPGETRGTLIGKSPCGTVDHAAWIADPDAEIPGTPLRIIESLAGEFCFGDLWIIDGVDG